MSLYYTADHEWVAIEGDVATVGITDHAQGQLGDLVFVQLPPVDEELNRGDASAVVESVKAASDVLAPLSGTVVEVNAPLAADPVAVNRDPQGAGWLFRLKLRDPAEIRGLLTTRRCCHE